MFILLEKGTSILMQMQGCQSIKHFNQNNKSINEIIIYYYEIINPICTHFKINIINV